MLPEYKRASCVPRCLSPPTHTQVVAVLSAALSEEVSGQLAGRKGRHSLSLKQSSAPGAGKQHSTGAATQGPLASAAADAAAASAPAELATSAKVAQQHPGTTTSSSNGMGSPGSQATAAGQQAGGDDGPQIPAASQGCGCVIS
jgi:hypothetical protein